MKLKPGQQVKIKQTEAEGIIPVEIDRVGYTDWFFGRRKDVPRDDGTWYRKSDIMQD